MSRLQRAAGGYAPALELPLTPRMRQVLTCAAQGMSAIQTAEALHIGERTVWTIRTAAVARLGAHTITQAVYIAQSRGEL